MAGPLTPVNVFRRLAFILIAVVGLIFLIVGGWLLAGHTSTVSMGGSNNAVPGNVVELRVDGDNAVLATPAWVGVASAGLGILLFVVAFVMMRRARKAV